MQGSAFSCILPLKDSYVLETTTNNSTYKTMNRKISHMGIAALMAATAATALGACATQNKNQDTDGQQAVKSDDNIDAGYLVMSDDQREAVANTNDFAFNLYRTQAGMDSRVVSPISVAYLMGILANGANGTTESEIMKALCLDTTSLTTLNETYKAIIATAPSLDSQTQVNIANCIAVNKPFALKADYSAAVKALYDAQVVSMDFASKKTLAAINGWCDKQTHGMIPKIVDSLDPGMAAVLMNAIYFNGSWAEKFDKAGTKTENFRGYTRDIKKVQMMHQENKFMYTDNSDYAAVRLPYGNGAYAMTVVLPAEGKSVSDIVATLNDGKFVKMQNAMEKCVVDLKLPRFTTSTETQLNKPIAALGAPSIFAGSADFSKMSDTPLYVSTMFQKAKIEVSEEGTKAAAVTAGIMAMASLHHDEPRRVTFHANRPFLYLITERSTNAIFFIGQYTGDTE